MRHPTSILARPFALVLPVTALVALFAGPAFAQKLPFPTARPTPASEPVVKVAPDSPRAALATYFDVTRRGRYTGREPREVEVAQRPFATGAGSVATFLALQAATRVGAAAAEPVALAFLRRVLRFTDAQIAAVEAGQVVTRKLPTADKPEIAAFGVVRVHTDKETFLGKLRDMESFRRGPSTLEIGLLGHPPSIEDLRGLSLDDADFEAARRCRPGDCGLKLSRSAMERIRSEMEWSAPDAKTKAAALMRQMLVEYTAAYMEGGTPAMATYHNRDRPQEMPAEFRKLLGASPYLVEYVPEFHRYLEDYPRGTLVGAENLFYWEKARFGPKPTISVYHVTIWKNPKDANWAIVSSKQIYASHYFRAGFDLSALLDAGEGAFYLLDLYRVRIDPPTGMLSGLVLGKIRGRIEQGVAERLKSAKAQAEAR